MVNNTDIDINFDGWNIAHNKDVYTFPRYLIILSGNTVTIPRSVHGLGTIYDDDWILLRNENGYTVYSFANNKRKMNLVANISHQKITVESKVIDTSYVSTDAIDSREITTLDRFLEEHPEKERVNFDNDYLDRDRDRGSRLARTSH